MGLFVYTCPCGKTVRHENPIFRNTDGSESGQDLSKVKNKCAKLCKEKPIRQKDFSNMKKRRFPF